MKPTPIPAMLEAARRCGLRWHCLSLFFLVTALCGCATSAGDDQGSSYLYRADEEFVRLVPIEPGAPPNSHPFDISADQLRRLLAGIEVSRAASIGKEPVFSQEELDRIVAPLVSALSKAGPNQDVTFAVAGHRGMFGRFSPESVTTGRLFVRDDSLNLIFGLVQARLDVGELDLSGVNPEVTPGARSRRIGDTVWEIDPGRGELHARRGDWLVFDRSVIPAAAPTQATPSTPDTDAKSGGKVPARVQEIENRLRVLDALRQRGVITEQEYLERRRAILEEL